MTYITYSNICANLVRNCLKEPHKTVTVAFFFFFVILFQMYLLSGRINDINNKESSDGTEELFVLLKELDFGEDLKFEPLKVLAKFKKEGGEVYYGGRKPQLALVFPDLLVDPQQILMVTVTAALQEIGYAIQVYSLEDGPMHAIWRNIGIFVSILRDSDDKEIAVDWLN